VYCRCDAWSYLSGAPTQWVRYRQGRRGICTHTVVTGSRIPLSRTGLVLAGVLASGIATEILNPAFGSDHRRRHFIGDCGRRIRVRMRGGRSEENPFQRWKHLHWFSEAATGLERTEQVANPKGVSKGSDTVRSKAGSAQNEGSPRSRRRTRKARVKLAPSSFPRKQFRLPTFFSKNSKVRNMHDGQRRRPNLPCELCRRATRTGESVRALVLDDLRSITREYEQHQKQASPMLKSAGCRSRSRVWHNRPSD